MILVRFIVNRDDRDKQRAISARFMPTILNACRAIVIGMVRYTMRMKLDNRNPPYLNIKTARLIRSVAASPGMWPAVLKGNRASGYWGTNVYYGYRHEVGGTFPETVAPYERTVRGQRFAVSGYTRYSFFRSRRMFGSAIDEKRADMSIPIVAGLRILRQEGRVPNPSELGGWTGV